MCVPDVGLDPSAPQEGPPASAITLACGLPCWGFCSQLCLCLTYPSQHGSLYLQLWTSCFAGLGLFWVNCTLCCCSLDGSVGGAEFRVLLHCRLPKSQDILSLYLSQKAKICLGIMNFYGLGYIIFILWGDLDSVVKCHPVVMVLWQLPVFLLKCSS